MGIGSGSAQELACQVAYDKPLGWTWLIVCTHCWGLAPQLLKKSLEQDLDAAQEATRPA